GLRNPFRFTLRPATGSADTTAGDPGTLYIGDVGWNDWEELDVAAQPGVNFGWPCYEGIGLSPNYPYATPLHTGCGSEGTVDDPPARTHVRVQIIDVEGREVWRDDGSDFDPGHWTLDWPGTLRSGKRVLPGLYVAHIEVGGLTFLRRCVVVR